MKRRSRWVVVVLIFVCAQAFAYKQGTHIVISGRAATESSLNDSSSGILPALGLGAHVDDHSRLLPSTSVYSLALTPMRLMQRGADDEDLGKRSLRHFFDPQHNGAGLSYGLFEWESSLSWSLGQTTDSAQSTSYANAKDLFFTALTGPAKSARDASLGKTFESLGHVIHHLQDMAQPQHVRNDIHCDEAFTQLFEPSWISLPVCPLGLAYRPSAYEDFTHRRGTAIPLSGYGTVDYGTFSLPEMFWDSDGRGIAAFTSRNFLSVGTNFHMEDGYVRAEPGHEDPTGLEIFVERRRITDPDLLGPQGSNQPLTGEIWFIGTPITDRYRGTEALNSRTSSYSIFSTDLEEAGEHAVFTLNRFNYAAANDFLLPRAVAYSAGLINYFFRGRIEIGLPADGIYGVVDHATTYATGQGFGKLKLKLRNASPDGVKPTGEHVPQTMEGGTLVAVAKYTLNSCYTPDLAGDFGVALDTGAVVYPANCTLDQYFAGEELISQSAAQLGVTLAPDAAEFEFDFSSQPIPINARDLRIQVIYTGQLGAETDGIAFGGRDISEPTHIAVYNNSDYYAIDGKLYTPAQIKADPTLTQKTEGQVVDPRPLHDVAFAFVPGKYVAGPTTQPVGVNKYVRVALLADVDTPLTVNVRLRFDGGSTGTATFPGVPPARIDLSEATAYISPFGIFRGMRTHMVDVAYRANSAVPLAAGELEAMSTHEQPDPGPTPIPVGF